MDCAWWAIEGDAGVSESVERCRDRFFGGWNFMVAVSRRIVRE